MLEALVCVGEDRTKGGPKRFQRFALRRRDRDDVGVDLCGAWIWLGSLMAVTVRGAIGAKHDEVLPFTYSLPRPEKSLSFVIDTPV